MDDVFLAPDSDWEEEISEGEDDDTQFEDAQPLQPQNRVPAGHTPGKLVRDAPFTPVVLPFEEKPFFADEFQVTNEDTFLSVFRKLLSDDIVEEIVTETNRFVDQAVATAPSAFKNWVPLEISEFWRFYALCLAMGITRKPAIKDYWSLDEVVITPFFSKILSRNRYK